jgi:hypothetical protein
MPAMSGAASMSAQIKHVEALLQVEQSALQGTQL